MRPADDTFETKTQAEEWLTLTEAVNKALRFA